MPARKLFEVIGLVLELALARALLGLPHPWRRPGAAARRRSAAARAREQKTSAECQG